MFKFRKILVFVLMISIFLGASLNIYANNNLDYERDGAFTQTQEYINAKKSAGARQSSYERQRLTKPILPDKELYDRAMGTYPTRKGVILITDAPGGSSGSFIGHAGIIWSQNYVEESFAKSFSPKGINGVWYYSNDWDTRYSDNTVYGVTVSGTSAGEDAIVADWAEDQEGKPYNWNFLNWRTRDSFYCSQLVYAGYLDNTGIDIWGYKDFVLPMDIYYNSNTYTVYQN